MLKKISKCHLQAAGTIVGLFVWEDMRTKISNRYSIMVIRSDCCVQWIVLNEENSAINPLNNKKTPQVKLRRQHPLGICCSCFHKEISMLVVAGSTKAGLYCVSFDNIQDGTKISDSTFEHKNKGSEWRLLSLLEWSVIEMYRTLIDAQKYEVAHHFATKHGPNKDEVLKSQWLHSYYEKESTIFFLSSIHDYRLCDSK